MDSDLCNLELELRRLNRKVVSWFEDWLIGVDKEENEHRKERSELELKGRERNNLRDCIGRTRLFNLTNMLRA
jgi:hypothetical protein